MESSALYGVTKVEAYCTGIAPKKTLVKIGTGFFYALGGLYLITNRHIVINEKEDLYPDTLRIYVHIDREDPTIIIHKDISLYDEQNKPLWLEHEDNNHKEKDGIIDVVAINIDDEVMKYYDHIEKWDDRDSSFFAPSVITTSTSLSIIGYPLGFYDEKNNLPVIRSGQIASVYGVPFKNKPRFLVDIHTHKGCSGAPVVFGLTSWTRKPMGLVGVLSGANENLKLGYVWYASLISEIIMRKKKI